MILSIEEAREILRVSDEDDDNLIVPLLNAIPDYLETSTGYKPDGDKYSPLALTVARYLLLLWFDAGYNDSDKLQKIIDNLLIALSVRGGHK